MDATDQPATTGGLSFMRRFVDYEVDETGYAAGLADTGDTDPGVSPEGVEGGAAPDQPEPIAGTAPAASDAPPWAPNPDEWQNVVNVIGQLAPLLNQPPPEQELPELDPYDENFGQSFEQRLALHEQRMQEMLGNALAPLQQQQADAWVDQQVQPLADKLTSESLDLLKNAASGIVGNDQAFAGMVDALQKIEQAAAARGATRRVEELSNLGNAPREPQSAGGAAEIVSVQKGEDEVSFAQRLLRG